MARTDQPGPPGSRADRFPPNNPELCLAASAARFCVVSAVPMLAFAWLAASWPGVLAAGLAAVLVIALLFVQAAALAFCARRGGATLVVGAYTSFIGRLAATAAVLAALQQVGRIHMPSLVISAISLMSAVLIYQSWHVCHRPSFFWINPCPVQPRGRMHSERTPT